MLQSHLYEINIEIPKVRISITKHDYYTLFITQCNYKSITEHCQTTNTKTNSLFRTELKQMSGALQLIAYSYNYNANTNYSYNYNENINYSYK